MIARSGGQVVLVSGAIPGEQVRVAIDKVGKSVAFGRAVSIVQPSPDRREPVCELACGGSLYGHIQYPRQLTLKGEVIADALRRIAKLPWPAAIAVAASPETGYRMRARLHLRHGHLGFFFEGTHDLCDAGETGQLSSAATAALAELERTLSERGLRAGEIELSENVSGDERAIHIETDEGPAGEALEGIRCEGATGLTSRVNAARAIERLHQGAPYVHDTMAAGAKAVRLRRHVGAFFQGNRFLLASLVQAVVDAVAPDGPVVDLYAGVGLFSVAVAAAHGVEVTAVEGDPLGAADLTFNAGAAGGAIRAAQEPVERFLSRRRAAPATVIVDPPRTGLSPHALQEIVRQAAPRLVYVSCDTATFARDARALIDGGYQLRTLRAFDLFPNTAHVETLATFERV